MPVMALERVQGQHVCHLLHIHGIFQVLLVSHDEDCGIFQMLMLQQCEQLGLQAAVYNALDSSR
jgi:hypothetical protein